MPESGTWSVSKDITPSIAWRREAWKVEALDDLTSKANIGTDSKSTFVVTSERRGQVGVERIWIFPTA